VHQPEESQVDRHVERKPVEGDPAFDRNPDGRDLPLFTPDADVTRAESRSDPEFGERCHQRGLDPLDEPAHAGDARLQLEDRVADELPRTMECHIPAALNAVQRNTAARQFGLAYKQVRRLCRPAQGNHRVVFKQHEDVGYFVLDPQPPQLALQHERPAVFQPAQTEHSGGGLRDTIFCGLGRDPN